MPEMGREEQEYRRQREPGRGSVPEMQEGMGLCVDRQIRSSVISLLARIFL